MMELSKEEKMTGGYLRVERNGKWQAIEIEHLTDQERETTLKGDRRLMQWLNIVCNKLHEIQPLLDELVKEGILKV